MKNLSAVQNSSS